MRKETEEIKEIYGVVEDDEDVVSLSDLEEREEINPMGKKGSASRYCFWERCGMIRSLNEMEETL